MAKVRRPITNKRVPVTKSNVTGFLAFGKADRFPQELLAVADESITAGACLDEFAAFIEGNGFNDEALADMVVNRHGETADEVLSETAYNISKLSVMTAHVGYTGLGDIASIRAVPAENVRLCEPDDTGTITHGGIFPYLDDDLNKAKKDVHTRLPLFNPNKDVVLAQMAAVGGIDKYYGQLIYIVVGRKRGSYYPIPPWYKARKVMETEVRLNNFDNRHIASDLVSAGFLYALENEEDDIDGYDDVEYDDEGAPINKPPRVKKQGLVEQIEEAQGDENASSIIVITAKNKEELDAIKFVPTTGADLADRYNAINDRTPTGIARGFSMPNELVNIRQKGGIMFSADEIKVASQLMQARVNPIQRKLEQLFRRIFSHWHTAVPTQDFTIENKNYFPENDTVVNPG